MFADPTLFQGGGWQYVVSRDGRFVMTNAAVGDGEEYPKQAIHITENWDEEFRERE